MSNSRIFILFFAVVLLIGCTQAPSSGSGNVVSQEEAITDFNSVDVSDLFNVDITQGESYSVVIRVDDNLVDHLEIVKQADTLKIGLKLSRKINNATLEAEVTMPELTGLDLSGASQANITGFKSTKDLAVNLSDSSSLFGDIEAGDISIDLSGSSEMTLDSSGGDVTIDASDSSEVILSGSGQNTTIDASGSSTIDLSNFPVTNANVEARDASEVTVNASGRLDVGASSASNIYYLGDPTMGEINTSSGSSVEPR
jgi:hypothetical protein